MVKFKIIQVGSDRNSEGLKNTTRNIRFWKKDVTKINKFNYQNKLFVAHCLSLYFCLSQNDC